MRLMVLQEQAGPGLDRGDEWERLVVHAYWQGDPEKRPLCGKDLGLIQVVVTEEVWDAARSVRTVSLSIWASYGEPSGGKINRSHAFEGNLAWVRSSGKPESRPQLSPSVSA